MGMVFYLLFFESLFLLFPLNEKYIIAGDKVSNFAKQNLHILLMKNLPETILQDKELQKSITTSLTETFKTTDLAILKEGKLNGWKDGSTAIVSLIIDDTLFIANLGDCKAVLGIRFQ
mgnify:CR=1 FL=1